MSDVPRPVPRRRLAPALWFVLAATLLGGCLFDGPGYRGPVSEHFDGRVFANRPPSSARGQLDVLRWKLTSDGAPPTPPVSVIAGEPPAPGAHGSLTATWVGHATVLLQAGGVRVLTDPIWSDRASPVAFAGPRRFAEPGVRFADLPPIDIVTVSHNHYDHCDLDTLARLHGERGARIVVPLGVDLLLAQRGIAATALDWWQPVTIAGTTVTAVPARHFSGRGLGDRNRTLWCGYLIDLPGGQRVYMAGDTGAGPHFAEIGSRYPGIRLALMPVGAYLPRWFMADIHLDPAEALAAVDAVGAQWAIGIHWNTFPMADDGPDDVRRDLAAALSDRRGGPDLLLLKHGDSLVVPALPP